MSKSKMILPLCSLTFLALTSRASDTPDTMPGMFRSDPAHTGVYSTAGKAKVQKERWRFKTGNVNRSTPVVMGGTV